MPAQVLVVEDEKIVAADLQTHLERLGYGVPGIFSTGEDALRSAPDMRPDVVLMDIHLKGRIDGIETAQIMQTRLNIPVIYVTAFADERTLQRAKATEPYGYVLKPFEQRELQTAVELALHKHVRERRMRINEQWLTGLISNVGAAILAVDHNGLVCLMNAQAEEWTGTSLTEALGSAWADLITFVGAGPDLTQSAIWQALHENRMTDLTDTWVFFPKTGRKAMVSGAVSTMPEPETDKRAAILAFRDVTAWQQLETQYIRARHLEQMQRLAGGLAHQFSNFLTLIAGHAESLSASYSPSDPRARDVHTIQRATERAGHLTRDLLSFSRGQAISLKVFDPKRTINNVVDTLQLTYGGSVKLETELDPATGKVEADPEHLEQMLTALVANARDATPEGGVVTVRSCNLDVDSHFAARFVDLPPGSFVRFDVVDHGAGMSYEKQSHIFEPFFSTKDRAGGLGLAAAYGLVKQNRGHIWFESEPQKGTTFTICLPRIQDAPARGLGVPRSLY